MLENVLITLKELKNEDLCFEDEFGEKIYDYSTLEEYYEDVIDFLSCETDITEFNNACERCIEVAKKIKVFKKKFIKIGFNRIKDYIEEWYYDNASNANFDYELYFSDRADKLLTRLVEVIHKNNEVYEPSRSVGFIDLSKELKEYIDDYYKED